MINILRGIKIGKKKALLLGVAVFLAILSVRFITIRSADKIVAEIAKREGFDLDDLSNPSFLFQQADKKWRNLSWEQRRGYFLTLLNEKSVKRLKSILNVLDENQQRAVIEVTARIIRRYNEEMPKEEWEKLKRVLNDERGRKMVKDIKRYYLIGLTPQERKKLHPIIEEIMNILKEVEG